MPLSRSIARFNRQVTNPATRLVAGRLPGFAIVTHRGRTSGKVFRTPVNVFRRDGGYRFALTYGPGSDWVRNVLSVGRFSIRTRGRDVELTNLHCGSDPNATWAPWPVRLILRRINALDYLDSATPNQGQTEPVTSGLSPICGRQVISRTDH